MGDVTGVATGRRKMKDYMTNFNEEKLKEAGFDVIEENIRIQWTPEEADLASLPAAAKALLA